MRADRRDLILGLILCLAMAALADVLHRKNDLLAKATRIDLTAGLITSELAYAGYHHRYHHVPSYAWLSDTELISIRGGDENRREIIRLDLEGMSVARRPDLEQFEAGTNAFDSPFFWAFSPVGGRILSVRSVGRNAILTVRTLDGTTQRSWTNRYEGGPDPVWLADGSGFVVWSSRGGVARARLHQINMEQTREIRLDQLSEVFAKDSRPLSPRRVPVPMNLRTPDSVAEFLELCDEEEGMVATRRRVSLPERLKPGVAKVFGSPGGDRLAWLIIFERQIPAVTFTRNFPYLNAERHRTISLFVSALDGSSLRPLGPLRVNDDIGEIAWTPDGRRLSFVHDNALWTYERIERRQAFEPVADVSRVSEMLESCVSVWRAPSILKRPPVGRC